MTLLKYRQSSFHIIHYNDVGDNNDDYKDVNFHGDDEVFNVSLVLSVRLVF